MLGELFVSVELPGAEGASDTLSLIISLLVAYTLLDDMIGLWVLSS